MPRVLMPLPSTDFDPSESAVPWKILSGHGIEVVFATPDGKPGQADQRMLLGSGLGPLTRVLRANAQARAAYAAMVASEAFAYPLRWDELAGQTFDAVLLPGGHAPGMRPYLESQEVQQQVADFFAKDKPVGAICHGVLVAARTTAPDGRSVLFGRKTTALTEQLENTAWRLTQAWLGNYYRTYDVSVQAEVTAALKGEQDFLVGPLAVLRDSPEHLERGFTVRDGNYLSARWPGDAHKFAEEFAALIKARAD